MGRLESRVAIVTGTARGIGDAIARRFAAEGALVAGVDVRRSSARQVASEVAAAGGRMRFLAGDISQEEDRPAGRARRSSTSTAGSTSS